MGFRSSNQLKVLLSNEKHSVFVQVAQLLFDLENLASAEVLIGTEVLIGAAILLAQRFYHARRFQCPPYSYRILSGA